MACILAVVFEANAQPTEPAPAAPEALSTPAPAQQPSASDTPATPPANQEVAPPTTLPPVEPSFPTPVPPVAAQAAPTEPAAAAAPADPLAGNVKFKPGKGLDIKSNDGNWSLNLKLKGQFLYELQSSSDEDIDARNYFFVRRLRLALGGSMFTKELKYKLEFTFASAELSRSPAAVSGAMSAMPMGRVQTQREVVQQVPLLDAFLEYTLARDAVVHVGQSKPVYGRERVLSDSDLQTVDRSIDDVEFNFDRDIGLELRSTDLGGIDKLRYYLGVYMAEDRNASTTTLGTGDFGMMYLARFEVLPMGSFEDTPVDFAHTSPKLSFGLAYAFVQLDATSAYATQSLGTQLPVMGVTKVDYNTSNFTADLLFKASGLSVLGAFHYRKASSLPEDVNARDGLGFVVQAQYFVSKDVPIGIGGNVSMVRKVGDDSTILERSEAGANLSYYWFEHGLKIDAEFEHGWREEPAMGMLDATLASPDNRVRVQLSFIL
ncbi:MAG TPA: porin [Polyangiales bacterium]|nr:porin [Polyangiales bacterium]